MRSHPDTPFRPRLESPLTRDDIDASSPLHLIEIGWRFTSEPTRDQRWMVCASHGTTRVEVTAVHLGDAFQEVERRARRISMSTQPG